MSNLHEAYEYDHLISFLWNASSILEEYLENHMQY